MSEWRPGNWKECVGVIEPLYCAKDGTEYYHFLDGVEAGADAILEAIWKMAKESPTGTFVFDINTIQVLTNNG